MKIKIILETGDNYKEAGMIADKISKALKFDIEYFVGNTDESELIANWNLIKENAQKSVKPSKRNGA